MDDNNTERNPTPPKEAPPGRVTRARRALVLIAKKAGNELEINRKVPLEEILGPRVAKVIVNEVFHPMNERRRRTPDTIPVDIADILSQMGYLIPPWRLTSDYLTVFPKPYAAARKALSELCTQGALQAEMMDRPNFHHERTIYTVADAELIKSIAKTVVEKPSH